MPTSRQLVAIMFTDIVGYTSLMGKDETMAFDILGKNRAIQRALVEQYGGNWIKELGDGVLASFPTVSDAAICAGKILQAIVGVEGLELRIGIHLGEVVFENNDVFGDGVNIASRILAQAKPGTICVSESVYNNIANKKGINASYLREEMLKNVKDPVRIYEVIIDPYLDSVTVKVKDPAAVPSPSRNGNGVPHNSIAVLPFVNMSNDPEQEYFSEGMAEEILNSLCHVNDLKVAGRTSSFHFKGKNVDLREVGHTLNVRTILEGSVRKAGNRLRITVQLINAEDGYNIWSENYDRQADDIFAIQDEIALSVTDKLKITLLAEEKANIIEKPTENKESYDLYLKGRFNLNKRGPYIKIGLEYFQQAIAVDPGFALAYTGIADAFAILAFYGVLPPHVAMPKARECAEKALQLDPTRYEALASLAFISTFFDWNWEEARKKFKQAFKLNNNYAIAHYWHCYLLSFIEGKADEAIREALMTSEYLEPMVPISHHVLSIMYFIAGKNEEALQANQLAIELDPNSFTGYRGIGLSLAGLKRYDEAIVAFNKSAALSNRHYWPLCEACWVHSLTGNIAEIKTIKEELESRAKTEYISGLFLCCMAYYVGDHKKALEYMELAFEERDSTLTAIKYYPALSFIREDPQFRPFIERMKFPTPSLVP